MSVSPILAGLVPALAPVLIPGPATAVQDSPAVVERRVAAMGTLLSLEVQAEERPAALRASEEALRALTAVEERLSTWTPDSELARLNRAPVGEAFELSPELARDLARARELWRATDGTFDPGVGALVAAWDLRGEGRRPDADELARALAAGGFGALELEHGRARRLREGLVLEEGGFGKGVGLDAALAALRRAGVTRATLDLGGQVAVLGDEPLTCAVADPRDRAALSVELTVEGGSLATSGNSERAVSVDGETLGHLLDPRTGRPAADFGSVTVWAPDATTADALSTALFVMGPATGMAWVEGHEGVEALYLVVGEEGLRALASSGLARRVTALDEEVTVSIERSFLQAAPSVTSADAPVPTVPEGPQEEVSEDTRRRLERLEGQMDALTSEFERLDLGAVFPPLGEGHSGLGPAASKVYNQDEGLSIGGYGEALLQAKDDDSNVFDFVRAVLYVGYKFNEDWVLNTEIEIEHADEIFLEFAYLDYLGLEAVNLRGGLLLIPMGFLTELHEPTTYLAATRPDTERLIIPSTWRENGAGIWGDLGPTEYRLYVVNGLDASGFSAGGLRGGRQKGSQALAEDFAVVGRMDFVDVPGFLAGASLYWGDSDQDQAGFGENTTTIYEVHAELRQRGLWLRGLAAMAEVDDVDSLNAALGLAGSDSVGEELEGYYLEAGYDLMQLTDNEGPLSVSPYVRWESIDTQAEVPSGFSSDPDNDEEILTYGLRVSPLTQLVFKLELQDRDRGSDSINFGMGYVF